MNPSRGPSMSRHRHIIVVLWYRTCLETPVTIVRRAFPPIRRTLLDTVTLKPSCEPSTVAIVLSLSRANQAAFLCERFPLRYARGPRAMRVTRIPSRHSMKCPRYRGRAGPARVRRIIIAARMQHARFGAEDGRVPKGAGGTDDSTTVVHMKHRSSVG